MRFKKCFSRHLLAQYPGCGRGHQLHEPDCTLCRGRPRVVSALNKTLETEALSVRARAGWALAGLAPEEASPHLIAAFERTLVGFSHREPDREDALVTLARALKKVGSVECEIALEKALGLPTLPTRVRRTIERLLGQS